MLPALLDHGLEADPLGRHPDAGTLDDAPESGRRWAIGCGWIRGARGVRQVEGLGHADRAVVRFRPRVDGADGRRRVSSVTGPP